MFSNLWLVVVLAQFGASAVSHGQRPTDEKVEPLASFGEPSISPDRTEVAWVSGGDILDRAGEWRRSTPVDFA